VNLAHVHLLLNHLPPLGVLFGWLLLSAAILRRSRDLVHASLVTFVAAALLALPVYYTGEPAEKLVQKLPGVEQEAIEEHEESAEASLVGALILGAASLTCLWIFRGKEIPAKLLIGLLCLSLIATGMLAWTAHLGGLVHHPEIR
jgi:hypothetical protein